LIGFLGDIHGKFDAIRRVASMPGVDAWLQIGDLGQDREPYPQLPRYFWFIKGNHENWEALRSMPVAPHGPYMANGFVYEISLESKKAVVRVAVLGGNESPKYTPMPRDKVPASRARHYLKEEIDRLLAEVGKVDILLTHEAPSPYMKGSQDVGKKVVTELSAHLKPSIHVFGHHHRYGVYDYGGVKTVGLEYGWSHAVLWDEKTGETEWVPLPA